MKKYMFSLMLSFCSILSLSAMSYEEAREQARFLTDKMAYELNLNDQQYNDCYEINLDYLLSVETADDIYGDYLAYRNADLRHILYDWQYTIFAAADYFFRPLSWLHNRWFFPVYRYYRVGYYYYGHPTVYYSYRGGHGRFYHHGGFYVQRRPHWNGGFRGTDRHHITHHGGMDRGGRGNGYHIGDRGHGIRGSFEGRGNGYRIGDGGRGHSTSETHRSGDITRGSGSISRGSGSISRGSGSVSRGGGSISRGSGSLSRSYDHPSSTRTTVSAGSRSHSDYGRGNSGGFSRGSSSMGTSRGSSSMGTSRGSSSMGTSRGSSSIGTRSSVSSHSMGGSRSGGFSGGSRGGGFGGSSRGGGGSRGGGRH